MKTHIQSLCILGALVSMATLAPAEIVTETTRTFTVNQTIADPQDPPQLFLQTINDSAILSLTRVDVGLHLVGTPLNNGFASDMYVMLNQNLSLTSILLNRVGVSDSDPVGFYYDGWNVTFSFDAAGGDIHLVNTGDGSGVLSGTYEPDGRVNPTDSVRSSLLDVFNGSTGNGDWRLGVADLSTGGQMQLVSWSLTLTGENTVPEPSTYALLGMSGLGLMTRRKLFLGSRCKIFAKFVRSAKVTPIMLQN